MRRVRFGKAVKKLDYRDFSWTIKIEQRNVVAETFAPGRDVFPTQHVARNQHRAQRTEHVAVSGRRWELQDRSQQRRHARHDGDPALMYPLDELPRIDHRGAIRNANARAAK